MLASALRAMCLCIQTDLGSQKAIAEKSGISATALSGYLSAAKFPSEPTISSIWNLMPDSMSLRRRPVPKTRAELAGLHARAEAARRLRLAHARARASGTAEVPVAARPAPLFIRNRCNKRYLRLQAVGAVMAEAAPSAALPPAVSPVPPAEGDRRHKADANPTWAGLQELKEHLAAGRGPAAMTILSNAASASRATDVRNVIAACRIAGLDGAAHAVLTNAGLREPEAVLGIVGSLHEAEYYEDAAILTRFALEHSSRRGASR
ncbi:hypothetical protein ACFYYY_18445 [Streptomyces sp. NPDC001834]|uniref:hypothetical protein n=1 Tax=Streptomyces sp. NPDC001834 TaxID=3364616 RepID=UPI0036A26A50